jgi:hypothetical protein
VRGKIAEWQRLVDLDARPCDEISFGRGDETYKRDWLA